MKTERTNVTARHLGFFLVALPLLLAVGPNSCRPIDVQCGDVLDLDHRQYRLTGDLVCPLNAFAAVTAAVLITGEGVHFNLRGYTITRDDDTGRLLRQGILVLGANAHINGGSIVDINCPDHPSNPRDCAAIRLGQAPGVRINGMSLHNNTVGIISFGSGSNADVHSNDITGNLRIGIGLFGTAGGAMITGNDLSDTGGFSFGGQGYLGNSDDVSLIGNVANNCASSGIQLLGNENFPPAQRNTIRGNETLGNARAGISMFGATEATRPRDNLIQSNTSFGNGVVDLREGILFGDASADCLSSWKDNDFDVAEPDCIE
ncbi:MAG: right-handed parallel beta-helix repeat-containing protein [Gammaproteobacteria bacterium]|nr:right-handed parallel beta-helix repeat-containing protein [Gammaproteobacteria bacterium]